MCPMPRGGVVVQAGIDYAQENLFTHHKTFQEKPLAEKPKQDIFDYLLWQRKQARTEATITGRVRELKKLARLGILYDSEAVKAYLATAQFRTLRK